jgi:adenine-specific DNA methylase
MTKAKKLIEVALPIREVSMESVRDKSIRHGHISTLHLWWARRPLPVCRAVVFASLVPDPLDPACPPVFVEAINILLKNKVYQPYEDIPFTAVADKMEDNPRNRLLCFIGKFSDEFVTAEKNGAKLPPSKKKLSAHSLIKWESKNDERILTIARKLIYVAHNAKQGQEGADAGAMMRDYEQGYAAVKAAEKALYETTDRHLDGPGIQRLEAELATTIEAFLDRMPKVFDPFAGGGAIPLEAARLGCRSYGNDINPVAHIIQRASLEFPQRFGKPITLSKEEYGRVYGDAALGTWQKVNGKFPTITLPNQLSHDVEHYANLLLERVKAKVGHLYPIGPDGKETIAYYFARTAKCSNPACGVELPLLKQFNLVKKAGKAVSLRPKFEGKNLSWTIKEGENNDEGWVRNRKNLYCPVCGGATSNKVLKEQFLKDGYGTELLAVITDADKGKGYRLPTEKEKEIAKRRTESTIVIEEMMPIKNTKQFDLCPWGFETYGSMFSPRQLTTLQTFVEELNALKAEWQNTATELEAYERGLVTYLAIWIDRVAIANTSFGRWHTGRETLEHPFSRQAIAMVFDYPESNPFCSSTGSALNQLNWIIRYLDDESQSFNYTISNNASSGEISQFPAKSLSAAITDPPYYDAIAYADLSDFFYVWLKRTVGDLYPANFATPQTPKSQECTALKHHHKNDADQAKKHFEDKLQQIFAAIETQTEGVVSIMFAHQSTEAWTTLCNSVLGANMNITGSWAMDTEMSNRSIGLAGAALTSSVTVSCSPAKKEGYGDFGEVQTLIEKKIAETVRELYALGFRGADLLTACFGQAVSVFGRYKAVEKANGDEVTVAELLDLAKDAAFKAIISDIRTDELTKFYIGWLNLNQFSEEDHDMVRKVTQIGLNIDTSLLQTRTILVGDGNKQRLASSAQRYAADEKMGTRTEDAHIDQVHRLMQLWQLGNRGVMLEYIQQVAGTSEHAFWRVMNSLKELLPPKHADAELVNGLLSSQEDLLREAKTFSERHGTQGELRLD